MHKVLLFILLISLPFTNFLLAQDINRIDGSSISTQALDQKLRNLQKAANVHGLTVSIVTKDAVLFQKAYGTSNITENTPLKVTDNFYAASLAKSLFAYLVMHLVEEGRLDLDKPLVEYLDQPLPTYTFPEPYEGYQDLKNDERYKLITARMCLSHSTGFPNWRYIGKRGINMEKELSIEFEPGTNYSYSGEGIQLLQFVVEQITKQGLEELAQQYVFKPFEMKMTSFLWQDRFEDNYALGHYKKKKVVAKNKRSRAYAAGSMETTPADYAKFVQAMLQGGVLEERTFKEMLTPQIEINSTQQFGSNSWKETEANKDIALSYGLGWGLYNTPHGKAVFKEGHINGWEHYAAFYPENDLGILIMANSSNGESIFKELLEIAVGDSWIPWYWQNYFPYDFRRK